MKINIIKIICLVLSLISMSNTNAKTSIVFRIDDFLFRDNTKQEQIVNIFEKYNIPLSVAWIPVEWKSGNADIMSDSLWNIYTERFNSGSIDIMQHGCYHHNFKTGCNPYMEFQSQNEDEQKLLISTGKSVLDSCLEHHNVNSDKRPIAFVYPCNVYDNTTIRLTEDAGFKIISANLTSPISDNISFYPCTTEDFFEIQSQATKLKDGLIIVLFHNYTINDEFTYDRLDNLLSILKKNPDIEFVTLRDLHKRNVPSYNGAFVAKHPVCLYLFKENSFYLNMVSNVTTSLIHGLLYALVFAVFFVLSCKMIRLNIRWIVLDIGFLIILLTFGTLAYTYVRIHLSISLIAVAFIACLLPVIIKSKK